MTMPETLDSSRQSSATRFTPFAPQGFDQPSPRGPDATAVPEGVSSVLWRLSSAAEREALANPAPVVVSGATGVAAPTEQFRDIWVTVKLYPSDTISDFGNRITEAAADKASLHGLGRAEFISIPRKLQLDSIDATDQSFQAFKSEVFKAGSGDVSVRVEGIVADIREFKAKRTPAENTADEIRGTLKRDKPLLGRNGVAVPDRTIVGRKQAEGALAKLDALKPEAKREALANLASDRTTDVLARAITTTDKVAGIVSGTMSGDQQSAAMRGLVKDLGARELGMLDDAFARTEGPGGGAVASQRFRDAVAASPDAKAEYDKFVAEKYRGWDRAQRIGPDDGKGNIGSELMIQKQRQPAVEERQKLVSAIANARARADDLSASAPLKAAELREGARKLEGDLMVLDRSLMAMAADYSAIDVKGGTDKRRGQVRGYTRLTYEQIAGQTIPVKQQDGTTREVRLDPELFNLARGAALPPVSGDYDDARLHRAVLFRNDSTGAYTLVFQQTQFIFKGAGVVNDPTMRANARQEAGYGSPYYDNAIETARKVKDALGDPVGFDCAGSSLGGGLATAASLATGCKATAFNPSFVHRNTLIANGFDPAADPNAVAAEQLPDGTHRVDAYVVPFDFVNSSLSIGRLAERTYKAGRGDVWTEPQLANVRGYKHTLPLPDEVMVRTDPVYIPGVGLVPTLAAPDPTAAHGYWVGATKQMVEADRRKVESSIPRVGEPVPQPLPTPTPRIP